MSVLEGRNHDCVSLQAEAEAEEVVNANVFLDGVEVPELGRLKMQQTRCAQP
jgi:hypothetical protein